MLNAQADILFHQGRFIDFHVKWLESEDCHTKIDWEYVSRKNNREAVVIIPFIEDLDRYLLVKQYRPAVGCEVVEFPAGLMDSGESVEDTARRELLEETGFKILSIDSVTKTASSPGITSEIVWLVQATVDPEVIASPKREETEILLNLQCFTVDSDIDINLLQDMVGPDTILDAKVAAYFGTL